MNFVINRNLLEDAMRIARGILIIIAFGLVLSATSIGCKKTETSTSPAPIEPGPTVRLELFVMSQCPFGTAAENVLSKLTKIFGVRLEYELFFITTYKEQDGKKTMMSLHGPAELEQDKVQSCIGLMAKDKQLAFIVRQNETGMPWQQIAPQLGLSVAEIEKCLNDGRADAKMSRDYAKTETLKVEASPTIFLNSKEYKGPASSQDLFDTICESFGAKPSVCGNPPKELSRSDVQGGENKCSSSASEAPAIPPDMVDSTPVVVTMIKDTKAFTPPPSDVATRLKTYYPGMTVKEIISDSSEGKALIEKQKINWLPAYLLPEKVETFKNFEKLRNAMFKFNDLYQLRSEVVGANVILGRPIKKGSLEIFYNPGSFKAVSIILDALDVLRESEFASKSSKIPFRPFVETDGQSSLTPRNGQGELEEALRQTAVVLKFKENFRNYLEVKRLDTLSSWWEDAANAAKIKPETLKQAAKDATTLDALIENSKLSHEIHPQMAAIFLLDNRELAYIRDKSDFRKLLKERVD